MKIRVQENSLRLRLSEAEVTRFGQTGRVEETILFGPGEEQTLRYVLAKSTTDSTLSVSFTQNTVTVLVPEVIAWGWVNSDRNGFEDKISNGSEMGLKIVVEKDLDCFHG